MAVSLRLVERRWAAAWDLIRALDNVRLLALAGKGGNVVVLPNLADLFVPRRDRNGSA